MIDTPKQPIVKRVSLGQLDPVALFGHNDVKLRTIQQEFDARIVARGDNVAISGPEEEVEKVVELLTELAEQARKGNVYEPYEIARAARRIKGGYEPDFGDYSETFLDVSSKTERIRAKTPGQLRYLEAVHKHDVVFAIGPAGTGKTYLAVAMAVSALKRREVDRIILTRPAVEAGESLGFLPGDFREKVDPYLKPLYDALHDMLPSERIHKSLETGVIEVVPLAYMRGRTLNSSFVILDEAQNTTVGQMKMFVTRLGLNSKAIITGDITQVDLPDPKLSGLIQIQWILANIEGIEFVYFTEKDVVRHRLVQEIIKAFDTYEKSKAPTGERAARE